VNIENYLTFVYLLSQSLWAFFQYHGSRDIAQMNQRQVEAWVLICEGQFSPSLFEADFGVGDPDRPKRFSGPGR
jgi:hypothetical protein